MDMLEQPPGLSGRHMTTTPGCQGGWRPPGVRGSPPQLSRVPGGDCVCGEHFKEQSVLHFSFLPPFLLFSWLSGLRIFPCGVAKVRGAFGQEEEEEDLLPDP